MTPVENAGRKSGYERFFGLKESPFSLAPDPRFLFASASHSAALAQVAYAIDRREPIVVVTGEIGTGKTLLCRTVLQRLPRKTFLSVLDDPLLGPDDLLKQLLHDFGVMSRDRVPLTEASRHELVQALQAFLRSLAAIHAHAVVIIDEAQHLQPAVLEQIRLLSNIADERGTLLQIILVGQRDVEPLLSRPELRQIQQRVTRRLRLERLTKPEVQRYVAHRLARARYGMPSSQAPGATELARELAEWEGEQPSVDFDPAAVEAIARITGGLPRLINLICDRALEAACAAGSRVVSAPIVEATARGLGVAEPALPEAPAAGAAEEIATTTPAADGTLPWAEPASPPNRSARWIVAAASLALLAGAIWVGLRVAGPRSSDPMPTEAVRSSAPPSVPAQPTTVAPAPPSDAAAAIGAPLAGTTATTAPSSAKPPLAGTTGGDFEIVVASFRTEQRATSVEAEIAALGVPARRRVNGTWQQVICGPFASREAAEEAQARLNRAGFTGTQIAVGR